MHLYNLTLLKGSSIVCSCVGNFWVGVRQQQICVARGDGSRLELLQVDPNTGKLSSLTTTEVFGSVRSLVSFRLTGGNRDYIVVGSDAGRISVLEYDASSNSLVQIHLETFGKSGTRRIVPGQYLAADPKGRSVMIGAVEKSKLVYILNRDSFANLTISSPLEAHKPHGIIYSIASVDVGFENPLFAALEVDYAEADQDPTGEAFNNAEKMLTYYELDLGLNHVVRKWSEPADPRANLLVTLPGGRSISSDRFDGPSGVIVCAENYVYYKHQGVPEHRVPIPRRQHALYNPDKPIIIVAGILHRMKGDFFVLLQSEEGDLFKVTIDRDEEDVLALKIKYFDTVPVSTGLCILKSGYLFVPSEFGNHHIYQFEKLGDEGDEISSADYPQFGLAYDPPTAFFKPRPLENLVLVDDVSSLCPLTDTKVANVLGTDAPQIFTTCGQGARSSLRMLQHGLEVDEMVSSPLGFEPTNVWAVKLKEQDEHDAYIVLSAVNATYVLSIGESIEQVAESGLVENSKTIAVAQVGADSILQVYTTGLVRIRADGRRETWPEAPQTVSIAAATVNKRQVVLATTSGELVYFEIGLDESLNEYMERKALGVGVTTMSISEVPEGRLRTPYLAVGCEDSTVRIVSLDPSNCLATISFQALTAPPSSISVAEIIDESLDKHNPTLFVNIGLSNGVLLRTVLDASSGRLTDTRTRFLGSRSVILRRVAIQGSMSILALSSRSWLNYTHQGYMQFDPLIYQPLSQACSLSAEVCPEGIIGITGDTLRIFNFSKLGQKVKQTSFQLPYTPKQMVFHPDPSIPVVYTVCSDHRTLSKQERDKILAQSPDSEPLPPEVFGLPRAEAGEWGSCLQLVDPVSGESRTVYEFENNEAAFCTTIASFTARDQEFLLIVGTAQNTTLAPRTCKTAYLYAFQIAQDGKSVELLHKTEVDDVPTALAPFQGKLAAGIGKVLRIYDVGKKRLLRKTENRSIPNMITSINTMGERLTVSDIQESIFFAAYKAHENRLLVFADDSSPRWVTCSTMVDYQTVAAGDKFGNVFINRLSTSVSEDVDNDPTGTTMLNSKSYLMGSANKTEMIMHFNIGDILKSITKTSLVAGGREVLLYTGFMGTVGVLIPLVSKEDVEFWSMLEMHLRTEYKSLVGRDHLPYRGYYAPPKAAIDGDLCEIFQRLSMTKQAEIAGELDRTVSEVLKKLEAQRIFTAGF